MTFVVLTGPTTIGTFRVVDMHEFHFYWSARDPFVTCITPSVQLGFQRLPAITIISQPNSTHTRPFPVWRHADLSTLSLSKSLPLCLMIPGSLKGTFFLLILFALGFGYGFRASLLFM